MSTVVSLHKEQSMTVGVVVALPEELSTLTAVRLRKGESLKLSDNLVVAYSGAGCANAQLAAELLIEQGVTGLISWGCAAALSSELKSGDLTLADFFVASDGLQIKADPAWHDHAKQVLKKSLPVYCGVLLESQQIVALSAEKYSLHASTSAIVLDMETVALAKTAQQHNLPFLAIRAIADPVTMDLPTAVVQALNPQGEVVLLRLLSYLLFHPFELVGLIKLGLHFYAAQKTLKQVSYQLDSIIKFSL